MPARLIPETPAYINDAEKKVTESLVKTLPDEVTVLHSVRITDWTSDREGDLLILWPNVGIAVIEIKGGRVEPIASGKFKQTSRNGTSKEIDPIDQARKSLYAIRDYALDHSSLTNWFKSVFMVAIPHSRIAMDYQSPLASRAQFIDTNDLRLGADLVHTALSFDHKSYSLPTAENCEQIIAALESKIPDVHDPAKLAEFLDERNEWVANESKQLERLLDFAEAMNRFELRGPAGSGKTTLALAQAHKLTKQGKRVIYLCYNHALAANVRHNEENLDKSDRIATITNAETIARSWGISIPEERDNHFWKHVLPLQLKATLERAQPAELFDAVVVDESQDFSSDWWQAILALLKDRNEGELFIFGDDAQNIFNQDESRNLDLPQLRLQSNIRNSQQISELASHLTDHKVHSTGLEGPDVLFLAVPEDDEIVDAADEIVEMMLEKYREDQVTLLMTKSRHGIQKEQEKFHPDTYLKGIWDPGQVFYSTVSKFKGLERRCVVLGVDGFHDDQDPREVLYVGITRAIDILCIVAHRSTLAKYLPKSAIEKLESNSYNPVLPESLDDEDDEELV